MTEGGHTLSNHGYRHIIFGKKPFVYGAREYLSSIDEVISDTRALNDYIFKKYAYKITLGRPPHYVDKIKNGFSSYDAYSFLGMQYMGASFDGGGWLPENDIEQETQAMIKPLERALEQNPDAFCGKIIFQKDGYNMAKRTPVAFALEKQLELLYKYGYTVVGVDKLMEHSRFSDISAEYPDYEKLCRLCDSRPAVFSDNCVYPQKSMTKGELALLLGLPAQVPMTSKELCKKATIEIFGNNVNPAASVDENDIRMLSDRFTDKPNSMSRADIIKQIII